MLAVDELLLLTQQLAHHVQLGIERQEAIVGRLVRRDEEDLVQRTAHDLQVADPRLAVVVEVGGGRV